MKITKNEWLAACNVSDRNRELLSMCYDVLEHNTIQDKSYPWGDKPVISPWKNDDAGIWEWDSAFHAVTASRWNTELAASCIDAMVSFQTEKGAFPDAIMARGHINDGFTKPPVLPWASVILYERNKDIKFLKECYDRYVVNEAYWMREQRNGEFFFYKHGGESGWDDSVRWDAVKGDCHYLWCIDLQCYMIMMYRALAFMAKELGDDKSIPLWNKREKWLTEAVEAHFFDDENGTYADVFATDGKFSKAISPASFMPLYIGIASKEHAEAMEKIALEKFYPGMPTISYDDPEFSNGYWRGTTWLNVAYFALKGLKQYGFDKTADEMREYLLSMIYDESERGIFENYDSKNRKGLHNSYFSWSAAFTIEFILNWKK